MKKTFKLLALAVMLIMGSQAMAQTRGAMFLGASFPVNDFAGNARFITSYNESYKLLGEKRSATVKYGTPFSFAWQVGAGIEVARNLVIGCSFYDLGRADVKAEKTGDIISTPMPNESSIHPMMVLARIGFSF